MDNKKLLHQYITTTSMVTPYQLVLLSGSQKRSYFKRRLLAHQHEFNEFPIDEYELKHMNNEELDSYFETCFKRNDLPYNTVKYIPDSFRRKYTDILFDILRKDQSSKPPEFYNALLPARKQIYANLVLTHYAKNTFGGMHGGPYSEFYFNEASKEYRDKYVNALLSKEVRLIHGKKIGFDSFIYNWMDTNTFLETFTSRTNPIQSWYGLTFKKKNLLAQYKHDNNIDLNEYEPYYLKKDYESAYKEIALEESIGLWSNLPYEELIRVWPYYYERNGFNYFHKVLYMDDYGEILKIIYENGSLKKLRFVDYMNAEEEIIDDFHNKLREFILSSLTPDVDTSPLSPELATKLPQLERAIQNKISELKNSNGQ
jgi:hypothetical protein